MSAQFAPVSGQRECFSGPSARVGDSGPPIPGCSSKGWDAAYRLGRCPRERHRLSQRPWPGGEATARSHRLQGYPVGVTGHQVYEIVYGAGRLGAGCCTASPIVDRIQPSEMMVLARTVEPCAAGSRGSLPLLWWSSPRIGAVEVVRSHRDRTVGCTRQHTKDLSLDWGEDLISRHPVGTIRACHCWLAGMCVEDRWDGIGRSSLPASPIAGTPLERRAVCASRCAFPDISRAEDACWRAPTSLTAGRCGARPGGPRRGASGDG